MNVGLVAIPFLLAKLWSVIPKLFAWPPVDEPGAGDRAAGDRAARLQRGVRVRHRRLNMQYWYAFKFNFVVAHYYGAVVFVASLVLHVAGQDAGRCAARTRAREHATRRADRSAPRPPRRRSRRRGLFAFAGAALAALLAANVGESIGGPLRRLAFLAPRRPGQASRSTRPPRPRGSRRTWSAPRTGSTLSGGVRECRSAAPICSRWSSARAAPDRLRRGLDDDADVDGVPLAQLAELAGVPDAAQRARALAAAEGRAEQGVSCHVTRSRTRRAAGAEGQRRRPPDGPRLPGADHRPRRCPACTT